MVQMNRTDTLSAILLVAMVALSLPALFGLPWSITIVLLILYVLTLTAFGLLHGSQTLGIRGVLVFFILSTMTTYGMEWLGTHLGIPFGHYYYTEQMGPMLMGVPLIIPLQWFNMMYPSYIMVTVILSGRKRGAAPGVGENKLPLSRYVLIRMAAASLLAGLVMVSWDFINDPYMVAVGMWVWTNPAEFFGLMLFGIPISNFLGWVLSSALAVFLFEAVSHGTGFGSETADSNTPKSHLFLVLVPYLYALVYQAASGLSAGIFSFVSVGEWGPIALAAAGMVFAAALVLRKRDI